MDRKISELSPPEREFLFDQVRAIYERAAVDILAAGPVCIASGRCCRFKEYGHTLFISNLEAAVLLATCPPYASPTPPAFCPFQVDKLCTARAERPLGCRVYFCDPTYQDTSQLITEKYLRELKELAELMGVEWRYAPLHAFLDAEVEV